MAPRSRLAGPVVGIVILSVALWNCTSHPSVNGARCKDASECPAGYTCMAGACVVAPPTGEDAGVLVPDAATDAADVCPAECAGGCDFGAKQCTITGSGGPIACPRGWNCKIMCTTAGACTSITCQHYQDCDITCAGDGACGFIHCFEVSERAVARSCSVACIGPGACEDFSCGADTCAMNCKDGGGSRACGRLNCHGIDCSRTCLGDNACGDLTCFSSRCDETCEGDAACGAMTCGVVSSCLATCRGIDPACGPVSCTSCPCDVLCDNVTDACPTSMTCPDPDGAVVCADARGRCDSSVDPVCGTCRM